MSLCVSSESNASRPRPAHSQEAERHLRLASAVVAFRRLLHKAAASGSPLFRGGKNEIPDSGPRSEGSRVLNKRKSAEERAEVSDIAAHLSAVLPDSDIQRRRGRTARWATAGSEVSTASPGGSKKDDDVDDERGPDDSDSAGKGGHGDSGANNREGVAQDTEELRKLQRHLGTLQKKLASLQVSMLTHTAFSESVWRRRISLTAGEHARKNAQESLHPVILPFSKGDSRCGRCPDFISCAHALLKMHALPPYPVKLTPFCHSLPKPRSSRP